jgi:solute carrier family 25 iron transporter 28/37
MFHDLIMTPTEVLKQRVQLMRSEKIKVSIFEVVSSVLKREGAIAFYRSFPVNYAMNIPFGSLIVAFNETLKHYFGVTDGNQGFKYYLCGGIAGAIASIPTTPLDVIKTKLNTQGCADHRCDKVKVCSILRGKNEAFQEIETKPKSFNLLMQAREGMSTFRTSVKYRNFWDAACKIMQEDGALGFFKGLQMRMAIQSVSSGVAWGTYQLVKDLLILHNKH